MKFYIKQEVFTFRDKFSIYNEDGEEVYQVRGDLFTLVKQLHINNMSGEEVCYVEGKFLKLLPTYSIYYGDEVVAEVQKKFSFFIPEYYVQGPDWTISGKFTAHDYVVYGKGGNIAKVSKKWFSFGDQYEIDVNDFADEVLALAVVLVIDACLEADDTAAVTVSSN